MSEAPHVGCYEKFTLPDFYALPVRDALKLDRIARYSQSASGQAASDPILHALSEVRARLAYLDEVGLGYLTLDRPTRTLSGGETERVNLTTCLGTRLVNTLFVLDEPSVGLHPRDTDRLVRILENSATPATPSSSSNTKPASCARRIRSWTSAPATARPAAKLFSKVRCPSC
jgi:excinuclease UvrABC ATPase subunit